jgi:hypothetical protein
MGFDHCLLRQTGELEAQPSMCWLHFQSQRCTELREAQNHTGNSDTRIILETDNLKVEGRVSKS